MSTAAATPVILIADDHALFRQGLRLLLEDELQAEVAEAESLDNLVERIAEGMAPNLVIVDLNMPGMAGAESVGALREVAPDAFVVVMSAQHARDDILSAITAGAHGFVPKSLPTPAVTEALRRVLAGEVFVPASLAQAPGGGPPLREARPAAGSLPELTRRQRDMLEQLALGRSNKEIARALNLGEGTVKVHLAALYRRLNVRTRVEAVLAAQGIIDRGSP